MNYKQQAIRELAEKIKVYGFAVYMAKSGTHGFFTDGAKVVCFHCDLSGLSYTGKYRAVLNADGRLMGSGWKIDGEINNKQDAQSMIDAYPPSWATGHRAFKFCTPAQHLKEYGQSSGYNLI